MPGWASGIIRSEIERISGIQSRLMAKIDSLRDLPPAFQRNGYFTEVYRQPNLSPAVNRGGRVGVMTSGASVQAASASVDVPLRADRSLRRSDFREIASMRAGGPTPRKRRARPAWIRPAVRVPGGRQGAGSARPGTRAGSA